MLIYRPVFAAYKQLHLTLMMLSIDFIYFLKSESLCVNKVKSMMTITQYDTVFCNEIRVKLWLACTRPVHDNIRTVSYDTFYWLQQIPWYVG